MTPRLTLTKTWYGFSEDEAQVVLRAFENPESVTLTEHLDTTQTPAKLSPLIDRVLLTAVIGDLLAHTMRMVERQELRIAKLEHEVAYWKNKETDDADLDRASALGPRGGEPSGPAV